MLDRLIHSTGSGGPKLGPFVSKCGSAVPVLWSGLSPVRCAYPWKCPLPWTLNTSTTCLPSYDIVTKKYTVQYLNPSQRKNFNLKLSIYSLKTPHLVHTCQLPFCIARKWPSTTTKWCLDGLRTTCFNNKVACLNRYCCCSRAASQCCIISSTCMRWCRRWSLTHVSTTKWPDTPRLWPVTCMYSIALSLLPLLFHPLWYPLYFLIWYVYFKMY